MIGRVEDSMWLTITCLKNLARFDNSGGLRFERVDRDGATQHVEGVADIAVEVPRHLFPRREDQMTDLNLVRREDPLNRSDVSSCHVSFALAAQRMAAKLRPRVTIPRFVPSTGTAKLKPAAVSFSGLLGSRLSCNGSQLYEVREIAALQSCIESGRHPTSKESADLLPVPLAAGRSHGSRNEVQVRLVCFVLECSSLVECESSLEEQEKVVHPSSELRTLLFGNARITLSCTKPRFRADLEHEPIVLAHPRNECLTTRSPECRRVLAHLHREIHQGYGDADATDEVAQVAE